MKYLVISIVLFFLFQTFTFSQCTGIDADAGPDIFTCDPTQILQLQGAVSGNYTRFFWTPPAGLNNPNVLDPIVTNKNPGKYTFKLTAEGVSTVNLITNGDFESGNTGFITGYTYTNINTTEGEYFIASNPATWNGGFSSCGDHTTGSGNMLLLNGHPTAGTNCWCQTVATVVGRSYQFEFWSMSVYPTNIAQLNVKLNGTPIGSTTAGGLCDWQRFMVMFTATSASTTLCISETTGIRGGNDFAIDDIALFEKCTDTDEVMVEIVNLIAKIDILNKPKCSSDPFDLTAIGSSAGPNIRYVWSTDVGLILSQNGLQAKGRGSGIYTVKVIYENGNNICETEASIEFIAPDILLGGLEVTGKVNCSRDSVRLRAHMSSGSGNYLFKWAPDTSILKGQNTDSIFVNKVGGYTVTITDQTSGCKLVLDYDVKADTAKPIAEITGDSLLDCRKINVQLKSTQTDSFKYKIKWIVPDQTVILNRSAILSLLEGNYKLFIEDTSNHCLDSAQWFVTIDTVRPKVDLGNDLDIDCNNDSVLVTNQLLNLNDSISYHWSINNSQLPTESFLLDKIISTSSHIVLKLVNEINGCEALDSLLVTDSRMIPFLDAGNDGLLTCKNKIVQLNAGINPNDSLVISWSSATGNIVSGINTLQPVVDQKGWYVIHILNQSNGCENTDSVFVDENTVKPDAITGPDLIFSCKDSIKTIDASGSSSGANIIYQWSTQNGNIKSGYGTKIIDVTNAGTYQLIVLDTFNGCSDTTILNVNPDINKPIVTIAVPDTLNCIHTEVTLFASAVSQSGGALDYQWSTGSGAPIQSPDSLQTKITVPGIYIFSATDISNGCSATLQTTVTIDTIKPDIDAGTDRIWNCATTQIDLAGINADNIRKFSYEWITKNGAFQSNPNAKNTTISDWGRYYFFVIDQRNGCSSLDSLEVIPDITKPVINFQKPDTINCISNSVQIDAQGSSSGNRYLLSWSSTNGNIVGNTNSITILVDKPGKYFFTILDTINKCSRSDSILVVEDKLTPDINIQTPLKLTCTRKSISLLATIMNAGNNYVLNWSTINGNFISPLNTLQSTVDKTGKYFFSVRNLTNGCENKDSVNVTENVNVPVDLSFKVGQPSCAGETGSINILNVTGGEFPLNYFLDDILIGSPDKTNITPGLHTIKIVDANGCSISKNFRIDPPVNISVTLPTFVKLNFGENYTIKPNFSIPLDSIDWIQWTPSDNLSCSNCPEPTVLRPDKEITYSISYGNKHGCVATASITLQILKRGIWSPNVFSPNGDNINDWFYPVAVEGSYNTIRTMLIYDRWGELVFQKDNFQANIPNEGWNGEFKNEKLNPGVFVYFMEVEWKNGELQKLKGDFTLIR